MRKLLYILLPLLLVSCENDVDAPDWPEHDPKLVITAGLRIEGDSVFVFCRVSRTMSLGEDYRVENAMVNDADVRVEHDGVAWEIPFRENYYPFEYDVNYSGVVPRGTTEKFVLTVKREDLRAHSILELPDLPLRFDSLEVKESGQGYTTFRFRLSTPVNRTSYEMYVEEKRQNGQWQVIHYWDGWSYTFISESYASYTEGVFTAWPHPEAISGKLRYQLSALSPTYSDYNNSRWYSGNGDSPFEPEPNNPAFNIEGDGIGFFWWELVGDPVEIEY